MKKNETIKKAMDNILGEESNEQVKPATAKRGRPREEDSEARTFRVKTELAQKLRFIAIKEGRLQKDILDYALESIITRYEKKHGEIDLSKEYEPGSIKELF